MKVILTGNGGREYAILSLLAQSPDVTSLICAPGNDAMSDITLVSNGKPVELLMLAADQGKAIADYARGGKYDLVVPGPEASIQAKLGDYCREYGIPFAGPCSRGGLLETSKVFQYQILEDAYIPRPHGRICVTVKSAIDAALHFGGKVAVRADGIAAGKGVLLAETMTEAEDAIHRLMVKRECGLAGQQLVIQELLEGNEISPHIIADRHREFLLESVRDYKRLLDGNKGPNTGGMGSDSSPEQPLDDDMRMYINSRILIPWRLGCSREGFIYRGVLYAGLMLTSGGAKVIEFNVRFGDPETQALLSRFTGDFAKLLYAVATDTLAGEMLSWSDESSVCVILASEGYGVLPKVNDGKEITGLDEARKIEGVKLIPAGIRRDGKKWFSKGGRVMGVTAKGCSLLEARERAYAAVELIRFEGKQFRTDIGAPLESHA